MLNEKFMKSPLALCIWLLALTLIHGADSAADVKIDIPYT